MRAPPSKADRVDSLNLEGSPPARGASHKSESFRARAGVVTARGASHMSESFRARCRLLPLLGCVTSLTPTWIVASESDLTRPGL